MVDSLEVTNLSWVSEPPAQLERLAVQMSAHGRPVGATWSGPGTVRVEMPVRKVAPGQSIVLYRGDAVVGGGIAV
jgi:tRNA U34 2-thiouridine synthase MnmA/TrmU